METSQVVVVTGGAYGIGRSIALRFLEQGARVVIADIDVERGRAFQAKARPFAARTLFVETDVREESQVERLMATCVERFGGIDVLCNNAGVERYKFADEFTGNDWSFIVDTNLRGAFLCSKYAHPYLKSSRGSIVFVSSVQAFANETQSSIYAATKAGLLGLNRSLALDFARDGIRVNAICPGAIHTGMTEVYLKDQPNAQDVLEKLGSSIPLGRIGQPEDVAPAVVFLASPAAAYITGAFLVIDGGLLSRLAL